MEEVLSVRLLKGASLQPPGDVVSFDVLDTGLAAVMRLADELGLGSDPSVSLTTSSPQSVASTGSTEKAGRDRSTSSWEEMELTLGRESTMTPPKLVIMALAGLFAAAGLHTGAVHVLIGSMLVAPAYEPLSRLSFALVNGNRPLWPGARDLVTGYGALAAGAGLFVLLTVLVGHTPLSAPADTYLPSSAFVEYWTTIGWLDFVVSGAGGIAGGLLIATNRRVLATGVVIILALVPSLALAVIELANGELALAGRATLRWILDVVLVVAGCALVFFVKRRMDRRVIDGA